MHCSSCNCESGCGKVAWILVIVGALNWGLVGLGYFFGGNWNLVNLLLGNWMWLEAIVYILVGASAVSMLFGMKKKGMSSGASNPSSMGGGQHM